LNERKSSLQVIDVRSPGEWKKDMFPARSTFVPELAKRMADLDRNKPTAVYCGRLSRRASLPVF
jgi:rhodanese-related sulfurtransferase